VAPTLDTCFMHRLVEESLAKGDAAVQKGSNEPKITLVPEALPALWHSRAGIVASGTATVEAAMMNTPLVMVYRVSPVTYLLGKPRVNVPRFAMVNLIAEEEIVPELVQRDFTAAKVAASLNEILPDGPAREHILEGLAKVKARLRAPVAGAGAASHPADRAAEIILNLAIRGEHGLSESSA
jgi:lipid-A-disaccharide synthase